MTSRSVFALSLRYGAYVTVAVAVIGSILGYVTNGIPGLLSALVGAVLAAAFMALTAVSIVVANRVTASGAEFGLFFGIIAAAWLVKLVVFVVVILIVRSQPWLSAYVFFFSVVSAVIGSLVADGFAMKRARVPYVGDIPLPGDEKWTSNAPKYPNSR